MKLEQTFTRVLILLLGCSPALAGEDLAEVLRRQGEKIEELTSEVMRLRGDRGSALRSEVEEYLEAVGTDPAWGEAEGGGGGAVGRVRVSGYFSLEFRDDGDGKKMEFDFHRLVPKIQADVADGILFETEIEIEGGGADVDFLSDNEILVEFAELRFEILEEIFTFKVGALLVGWGRFNKLHDDPLNDLTDRPEVSLRLGAVAFDQPGVGAEGTLDLGRGWFVDYDLALVQGFDSDISSNNGVRDGRQSFRSDNNENKQLFWRFVVAVPVRFVDTLEIGHSGTVGKYDDAGHFSVTGFAFDLFVKKGRFELVAETMNLRFERDAAAPPTDPRRMDGWYVEARAHFFPSALRGRHRFFNDESTFTFVVRVEALDLNHSTTGAAFRDDLSQVVVGINFRPVERTVFKIDYTFIDSDQAGFQSGSANRFTISWASFF
ncbi:MAG: hypothetical protein ACT4PV_02955 [Planctomycetaceae bacterium]